MRSEALVTQRLNMCCPLFVPHILIPDILPTTSWCWFLLADAGEGQPSVLTLSQACTVASALGRLQCETEHDPVLPGLLTDCSAHHLYRQLLSVCSWASQAAPALPWHNELQHLTRSLERAHPFFTDLAAVLAEVPATIIHGDLWSGNVMLTETRVCFLDWGDALWGVGGTSLSHLLFSSLLGEQSPQLWEAYQQGRGIAISQAYRDACTLALDIVDLVVDQAIAISCGQGPEQLKGLLPGLQQVVGAGSSRMHLF